MHDVLGVVLGAVDSSVGWVIVVASWVVSPFYLGTLCSFPI